MELRETKELNERNESKIKELNAELSKTANELQEVNIAKIGFEELQKERESKISILKKENGEIKMNSDALNLQYGTLTIKHNKLEE